MVDVFFIIDGLEAKGEKVYAVNFAIVITYERNTKGNIADIVQTLRN
tara:strand:- start:84 stop:224 length:141 start_codon:yes stop_codon:yes gene_type:complete